MSTDAQLPGRRRATGGVVASLALMSLACGEQPTTAGSDGRPAPAPTENARPAAETAEPAPVAAPRTTSLRTSQPTGATKWVLAQLEGLEVLTFFAPGPVRDQVFGYSSELGIEVHEHDHGIDPELAAENEVSENGTIVLRVGEQTRRVLVRDDEAMAPPALARLDERVLDALEALVDRGVAVLVRVSSARLGATEVRRMLKRASTRVEIRRGSDDDPLPDNTSLVMFIDNGERPIAPAFAPLAAYIEGGGAAIIALEPAAAPKVADVLRPLNIEFDPTTLASDKTFVVVRRDSSDHGNVATDDFADHPAVAWLRRETPHPTVAFFGAGALRAAATTGPKPVPLVTTRPDSFADLNGNFVLDAPAEERGSHVVAMASERDDRRVVVYADASWLDDSVLASARDNRTMLANAVGWLIGALQPGEAADLEPNLVAYPLRPIDNRRAAVLTDKALWSASVKEVKSISAELGGKRIELTRGKAPTVWWGRVHGRDEGGQPTVVEFPVGDLGVRSTVESLASLTPRRALGKLDEPKRAELGFDRGDQVQLTTTDATHTLIIGNPTDRGAGVVVLDADGDAYVVDTEWHRSLLSAERMLPMRRLIQAKGLTEAKLVRGASSWKFTREHAGDPMRESWVTDDLSEDMDGGDAVDRALQLRATAFDRKASSAGMRLVAHFEFSKGQGDPPVSLDVFADDGDSGVRYYAQWPGGEGLARLGTTAASSLHHTVDEIARQ